LNYIDLLLKKLDPNNFQSSITIKSLILYGSILYKPLAQVRDIDVFAITNPSSNCTMGRLEIMVSLGRFGRKRASIYVVNEKEFHNDALYSLFGGRWNVIGYHGYSCVPCKTYDVFYAWGVASLIYQLGLSVNSNSEDFYCISIPKICSIYPIYSKSLIDYLRYEKMREIASEIYKRTYEMIVSYFNHIQNKSIRIPRQKLKKRYFATELCTRPLNNEEGIRPFYSKLINTLESTQRNQKIISNFCGEHGFKEIINSYTEAFDILNGLKTDTKFTEKYSLPLIGRHEINCDNFFLKST